MKAYYDTKARVRYYGRLPVAEQPPPEQTPIDYRPVRFTLSPHIVDNWKEPAHLAVANLRTLEIATGELTLSPVPVRADTMALFRFLKVYGPLTHRVFPEYKKQSYTEDPVAFGKLQFVLRRAWHGNREALKLITGDMGYRDHSYVLWKAALGEESKWEGLAAMRSEAGILDKLRGLLSIKGPDDGIGARAFVRARGIQVEAENLWSFTRLLFARDYVEGRIRVCKNPDCATPYFVQQRKGQVYCTHECAVLVNVRRFRKRQKATRPPSRPTEGN